MSLLMPMGEEHAELRERMQTWGMPGAVIVPRPVETCGELADACDQFLTHLESQLAEVPSLLRPTWQAAVSDIRTHQAALREAAAVLSPETQRVFAYGLYPVLLTTFAYPQRAVIAPVPVSGEEVGDPFDIPDDPFAE